MRGLRYPAIFAIVTFSLSLYSTPSYSQGGPLPQSCSTQCKSPFGEVLGRGTGDVVAYSNCSSKCVDPVPARKNGTYTGIKWQCVEYARRWLLVNEGVVYGDVDVASDIWGLNYVTRVKDNAKLKMLNYTNGSMTKPKVGDLLIYAKAYLHTGHVAVISAIDAKDHNVHVLEQNYNNTKWHGNYARSIPYIIRHRHYWILDAYLLGWKHVSKQLFIAAPG